MNPYVIELMLREKREEILREAERQRMIAEYEKQREKNEYPLAVVIGDSLIRLGCWLKEKYAPKTSCGQGSM